MITLQGLYEQHCRQGVDMSRHLPRLRSLAAECDTVVEFGVRNGVSTTGLLLGAPRVLSYDVQQRPKARALAALVGPRWEFVLGDCREAAFTSCDMLFIDSRHTYGQCSSELEAHAHKVRKILAFHDTVIFGQLGEDGGLGIMPAIEELLERDPSWKIDKHYEDGFGLLVLRRR